MSIEFTEENIRKLFGHEAAEDENIARLKEYYFKNDTYTQVSSNLPLRILVGHKGIGKSALFQIVMSEDKDTQHLPVLIKPDDIVGMAQGSLDFLQQIRDWKKGLSDIISKKILSNLEITQSKYVKMLTRGTGRLGALLIETFKNLKEDYDLSPVQKLLIDNFLSTQNITIYVDDLDRGWISKQGDIVRISTLINASRDLIKENPGLRIRLALRSDVYYLVRTSDESTDKIASSIVWHTWTNHEILVLLIKRIESFFGRTVDESRLLQTKQKNLASYLNPIFEEKFTGFGKWEKAPMYRVLMSLIRKRPRDLVLLCTLAAQDARKQKSNKIGTENLQNVFEQYSQERVQDTINEFKSELPDIGRLLLSMKPTQRELTTAEGYTYSSNELIQKLKHIISQGDFVFSTGMKATAQDLAQFLYKINFITARKELSDGTIDRKYFEEQRFLQNQFANFGYSWEMHMAYRWALQPDSINGIYKKVALSSDEK